jgi:hypothetical protein
MREYPERVCVDCKHYWHNPVGDYCYAHAETKKNYITNTVDVINVFRCEKVRGRSNTHFPEHYCDLWKEKNANLI